MVIQIDEQIRFEVRFAPLEREEGYEDDIWFSIHETGPRDVRIFASDSTNILLTPDQAEQLAVVTVIQKCLRAGHRSAHVRSQRAGKIRDRDTHRCLFHILGVYHSQCHFSGATFTRTCFPANRLRTLLSIPESLMTKS